MFPDIPKTPEGIAALKRNVMANRSTISHLVSLDLKSAEVVASFNERGLDYKTLFYQVQDIVKKYQDANNTISVAGEPIIRGYGYYYEPVVTILFFTAVAVMILILWATGGQRSRWWAPIVTGTLSAVWGLGFVGVMGYDFDPVMLVIPFILTARDMSHGIQWQGRYHDELDRLGDKFAACAATTDFMLPPGFLSIMADISGIIFISFGGIPVLQHIALAGTVWLAGSLTMVFIFQPILMSYLPIPVLKHKRARVESSGTSAAAGWLDWLVHIPTRRGALRMGLLVGSGLFLVYGVVSGLDSKIGYSTAGTPLYKANSKVNRDIGAVGKNFPLEDGWVILTYALLSRPAICDRAARLGHGRRHAQLSVSGPEGRAGRLVLQQRVRPFQPDVSIMAFRNIWRSLAPSRCRVICGSSISTDPRPANSSVTSPAVLTMTPISASCSATILTTPLTTSVTESSGSSPSA